ncbi:MAG: ferritin family protein [Thermodesulfobacteriota bacterium]
MGKNENLIRIFEYALSQERAAKGFFEDSMRRMAASTAKKAFGRLAEEEDRHIDMINRILIGLRGGPDLQKVDAKPPKMGKTKFLDKREKTQFLEQCTAGSGLIDVGIFNTAYLFEKDIAEFYGAMAEKTEGESRKALLMLARWEEGHAEFFKEFKDRLTQVFARF